MRKFYVTLVISILVQSTIFSQTAPISFSLPTTKFCPGQIFPISFTNDPSLNGHTFQVQLSNSSGSFASGVSVLGSGTSSPISCTMNTPSNTSTSFYKVRIIDDTAPANVSNESATITNNSLSNSNYYILDTLGGGYANLTLCTGSSQKFFASLTQHDSYGATYEWRNTSAPSTVLGTQYKLIASQSGYYTVTIAKPGCSSASSYALNLSYSSSIYPNLPFPGEVHCLGSTVELKSTYNSETVVYEWKKDGVVIPNNTGKLNVTTSGEYSVKVIDNSCQYTSGTRLNFGNNVPIQINSISDTIEICNGSTGYLYISANFIPGNTTQWYKDGQLISPQPQNTFTRSYGTPLSGTYTVKLTEGNCNAMSNPVVLKAVTNFSKPTFTVSLEDTTCIVFPVLKANIPDSFTGQQVQWIKNGVDISGANSKFFTTSSQGAGRYSLRISQGSCQSVSNEVNIVSVSNNPPYYIKATPILCSTSFELSLKNPRSFSFIQYQWFKDGIAIVGATSSTYNATISGIYKLRVSMSISSCVGFSQNLSVTISSNVGKPIIELNNSNVGISKNFQCVNNLGTIFIKNSTFNYYSVFWKKDGVNIPNISGATNYLNVFQSGNYSLRYTFGSCTVESDPIKINIGDKQQSIKTNTWNDSTSWACGTVPLVTDEVIINKGHTISLPDNYTGFLKNLELNGALQKGNNAQLKFQTN